MDTDFEKQVERPVAVLGDGSFGTAIANILAENTNVLLYSRSDERVSEMRETRKRRDMALHPNITPLSDLKEVVSRCEVLFPIVPSSNFRALMQDLSSYLKPYHILIHGTKGLDIQLPEGQTLENTELLDRNQVLTMSEVIKQETIAIRIGCLAGPNLAKELLAGHPAATVVASHFDEVIKFGQQYLKNDRFQVYGNSDLIGIELAGVLKNIIALASGALHGLGFGENAKGMLVSRGMIEIIYLGRALGGNTTAFLGLAGIGDLVATSNSQLSRNFSVGFKLAQGQNLQEILTEMEEVAEGVNTVKVMYKLSQKHRIVAPITQTLYQILFEGMTVRDGLQKLMRFPLNVDIEFLKELD